MAGLSNLCQYLVVTKLDNNDECSSKVKPGPFSFRRNYSLRVSMGFFGTFLNERLDQFMDLI